MRAVLDPFTIYLGALEAFGLAQRSAELLTVAAGLASLTVLAYRLGISRQEMLNLKHNVGAEVDRYHDETVGRFSPLEQRFATVERFIALASRQRVATERWQSRIDTKVEAIDDTVTRVSAAAAPRPSHVPTREMRTVPGFIYANGEVVVDLGPDRSAGPGDAGERVFA